MPSPWTTIEEDHGTSVDDYHEQSEAPYYDWLPVDVTRY